MREQEEIESLRKELLQLQVQLKEQQEKIAALHSRLLLLITKEKEPVRSVYRERRSLENFIGLRLIHLIGIIVLVTGLSLGVKYAIDRKLISEGLRIFLAYGAGIVLYILSLKLKPSFRAFSAILFSGGMASLYFTTYAAFVYYSMMPFAAAFLLMIGLTVFTVYHAMVYDRQEIAWLGLIGAYGIPFLISRNSDRADLFFLYITLINLGILYLCAKRPWQNVGRLAQAISWILFIGWASTRFDQGQQWIGVVFMSLFFVLFLFNALSGRIFQKRAMSLPLIYQVSLNTIAFYIASLFVLASYFSGPAFISLFVSGIAALQAIAFQLAWREEYAGKVMAAFAFTLFIAFIGFKWEGLTVTLLWLFVAVFVFGLGVLKKWAFFRIASIALMGVTLLKLVAFDSLLFSTVQKVISYIVLGVLLLLVSFLYQKYRERLFKDD